MVHIRTNEEIEENIKVELFDNKDSSLGMIQSGLILLDICYQIKNNNISGYYVIFNDEKTIIQNDGRIYFNSTRPFPMLASMLRDIM